ncbi:hypothetical protein NQ314_016000 [Rhamnusium bicolor]|uniref:Non-structural maintenance of chromosomes element 1 homolog n=1 Tax=Rhamnusium bicolor TaxID=1586634 RepID=A0AAV8WWR1_9CUCU|nr:hypothetical protein NQ314_016000 [Rhamnusium bicolor]
MQIYHRYFIQYMLKNGVTTVDNAFNFCKHISKEKIENMTHFKTLVIEVNREISKQFYRIVFNTCEVTNQDLIVWLSTKDDDISKHQIAYSALELEYFNAILQQILGSDEHQITFIVCINITSTLTSNYSRDNGQKILNKWLKGGYYIKHGEFIYLGPRTILEFASYLRSHCPDCICNLCSELVFTGTQCSHCYKKLHSYCLAKYLLNQSICPCCKNIWMELNEETYTNAYLGTELGSNQNMDTDDIDTDEMTSASTSYGPERSSSLVKRSGRRNTRNEDSQPNHDLNEPGPSGRKCQK